MQTGEGLITKIFSWISHPYNSQEQLSDWAAFTMLALLAAYLWSTVIREID